MRPTYRGRPVPLSYVLLTSAVLSVAYSLIGWPALIAFGASLAMGWLL